MIKKVKSYEIIICEKYHLTEVVGVEYFQLQDGFLLLGLSDSNL